MCIFLASSGWGREREKKRGGQRDRDLALEVFLGEVAVLVALQRGVRDPYHLSLGSVVGVSDLVLGVQYLFFRVNTPIHLLVKP